MSHFTVEKVSDTLTRISLDSKRIILVGTAHVSAESMEEVERAVENEAPDHLCVEMDEMRLKNLEENRRWSAANLKDVLRRRQGFMLMANLALASFQRRIGADTGVPPGSEMRTAVKTARERGIPFTCADRSIQVTLTRAWRKSGLWTKIKLISSLMASVLSSESVSADEIEGLKESNAMQNMMEELADYLPSVKGVLIDERDRYLAAGILRAPGETVLAVVGAAHVPGIIERIRAMAAGDGTAGTAPGGVGLVQTGELQGVDLDRRMALLVHLHATRDDLPERRRPVAPDVDVERNSVPQRAAE